MKDKLADLHYYDCLRTNKSMLASSVETRVPFLDPELLDIAMTVPVNMKHPKFIKVQIYDNNFWYFFKTNHFKHWKYPYNNLVTINRS